MDEGKKVLVSIAHGMLAEIDYVAKEEHRTRSDLIREALRRYINSWRRETNVSLQHDLNLNIATLPPPRSIVKTPPAPPARSIVKTPPAPPAQQNQPDPIAIFEDETGFQRYVLPPSVSGY